MTLRLGALHDALSNPGDQELARKAAEEVAGYESRLAPLETKVAILIALSLLNLSLVIGLYFK